MSAIGVYCSTYYADTITDSYLNDVDTVRSGFYLDSTMVSVRFIYSIRFIHFIHFMNFSLFHPRIFFRRCTL